MKKTCARLISAANRFTRQTRGSMAVWATFLLVPLFGLTGLSLDAGRAYLVKSRLQQALDAGALAAGRTNTADINAVRQAAEFFFKANFPAGFMDATIVGPNVTVVNDVIKVEASATIPSIFVHFVGHDNMTVSGSTEVTRKTIFMDVVVSVDISGSMGSSIGSTTRIQAAKNAANTLIDILYGAKEDAPLLKFGLVQWNSMTNVTDRNASYAFNQTTTVAVPQFINPVTGKPQDVIYRVNNTDVPLLAQPHAGWKGCVGARFDIEEPDGYTDDGDLYSGPVTINGASWIAWWPAGTSWSETTTTQRWNKKRKKWDDVTVTETYTPYSENQCPSRPIQRLTTIRGQAQSAVSTIDQPGGNTNLIEGLGWAWRMLDKESPWTESTVLPNEPGARIVRAIVLMTDGQNTQSTQDAYAGTLNKAALDWRTKAIADRIKLLNNPAINPNADKEQWVIYTIQFAERNAAQEAFMKSLATAPTAPYYQFAPDAAALSNAFQEIGNHLSSLRISR